MHQSRLNYTAIRKGDNLKKIIAKRSLLFSLKGSAERKKLEISIGEPYIDSQGIAKCAVEWDGLFEDFAEICGMDSIQALQLASDIDSLLTKLQKKYDFYWSSGESYFDG